MLVCLVVSVPPVVGGLCVSTPQLSSPATTPIVSSSVGSGWLQLGSVPETSACARQGHALQSSCDGCHLLLLLPRCHLPALHVGSGLAGGAESAVQLVIAAHKRETFKK